MRGTRREFMLASGAALAVAGCGGTARAAAVERFDPALDALIDPASMPEELGGGYVWAEGPAWDRERNCLYFTDVPGNTAWRWREGAGVDEFLSPSGIEPDAAEGFREPGANGLWYEGDGSLLICNHGRRAVERMDIATGTRTVLADRFGGEPLNSPNDLVRSPGGTIYFTDPPYGLEGLDASPLKRQDANGVYRLAPDGRIDRLIDDMTFPNGIALSPDGRTLYVSQSDPEAMLIRRLTLEDDGEGGFADEGVWFDAARFADDGLPGLPDGMAVAATGHVFATGPGGVLVLSPQGEGLGRILTGRASANCAFGGEDGSVLFITAHDRLLRIPTRTRGVQWS